jgi:hypothetical protein
MMAHLARAGLVKKGGGWARWATRQGGAATRRLLHLAEGVMIGDGREAYRGESSWWCAMREKGALEQSRGGSLEKSKQITELGLNLSRS